MNRRSFFSILAGGSAAAGVGMALAKVPAKVVPVAVPDVPPIAPELPDVPVEWFGDTGEGQTVLSVLSANNKRLDFGDMPAFAGVRADYAFYYGDQWPEGAKRRREDAARPCLVINRLPAIVSRIVHNSKVAGEIVHPLLVDNLILEITRRNKDAQLAYNYQVSMRVERESVRTPRFVRSGWSTRPVLKESDLTMDGKEYVAKVQAVQERA